MQRLTPMWSVQTMVPESRGNYVLYSDALACEAALQERVRDAENIMLLHRDGKHGEAQIAYMDYCGKYLGEPICG